MIKDAKVWGGWPWNMPPSTGSSIWGTAVCSGSALWLLRHHLARYGHVEQRRSLPQNVLLGECISEEGAGYPEEALGWPAMAMSVPSLMCVLTKHWSVRGGRSSLPVA